MAVAGYRILHDRQSLCVKALNAIAAWSNVESFMLKTYVELAGGADADAAAIFVALETRSAKSAAIDTLARLKLDDKHLALLRAIISIVNSTQKTRDKLAHWTWGISPQIPDAVLLSDPRNLEQTPDKIFVYRAKDFDDLTAKCDRICGWGMLFRFILNEHPVNSDGRIYDKLYAEPEIQNLLNRRKKA